jgi:tryptophanyl-tRNA synthetase
MTPGGIANELSKLDFPAPTNLRLNLPPQPKSQTTSPTFDTSFPPQDTGDISGPEPEAITEMRRKTRSESMSQEISEALAKMKFPQPERIFGPDEVFEDDNEKGEGGGMGKKKKEGVNAGDWEKVMLDDVPEAVKEPVRMSHSRNTSRV